MSDQNSSGTTPTITNAPEQPTAFDDRSAFSAAYERRLSEIQAVKDDELALLNIDVHSAITTVLGVLPEILELKDGMLALASIDQQLIQGMEDYAQAAGEANSRYVTAMSPEEDIVALNEQAIAARETIRSDATALANRGLVSRDRLSAFKGRLPALASG
jgi:hypothetical protein